jgi:hypothetical protein
VVESDEDEPPADPRWAALDALRTDLTEPASSD